ncbi:kinase-like domain-containing protein [Penicillium sp. IBT 31633x]|nr:kinase-like domain-containing protein [Penicillium sp. IBT 31633x]
MSWIYFQRKSTGTRTASLRLLEYAWKKCVKGFSHNGRAADEDISTLFQKYGKLCSFVGRGSSGSIFLSHKTQEWRPELRNSYAVKVYCRKADLGGTAYRRRVESEFYILSLLKHRNIIRTFDLLSLGDGGLCAILEYCSDGDLCSLIILSGHLEDPEADCFFKQLMQGVDYLHEMGVAHRDLKPENLLLSPSGCLKISDFGNAECFRLAWESDIYMSKTRRGSRPYLSPEQYLSEEFDPRSVDVWAAAITYLAMRTGRLPWKVATDNDECFKDYVACYKAGKGNCHIEDLCQVRMSFSFGVP